MTAAVPLDDDDDFYSSGDPEIDAAVRFWLPKLAPITAEQRVKISAIFSGAHQRCLSETPKE